MGLPRLLQMVRLSPSQTTTWPSLPFAGEVPEACLFFWSKGAGTLLICPEVLLFPFISKNYVALGLLLSITQGMTRPPAFQEVFDED
jgi:hypothetical protein